MRISSTANVRNDLLQIIADKVPNFFGETTKRCGILVTSFSQGAHVLTTKSTYTVPANKRAILLSTTCQIHNETAPTAIGGASLEFTATLDGIGSGFINGVQLRSSDLSICPVSAVVHNLPMEVGDSVKVDSNNGNTGGLVAFRGSATILEFDL